jgi:hypothetical protein
VIEHVAAVSPPPGADPRAGLAALSETIAVLQRDIRERLEELGVRTDIRQAALVNALFVALEPDQVDAIAEHPDVRVVRWDRPADVAL